MRRLVIFLIASVFVMALVLYMVAYTVRFTEVAVVTTFGRAADAKPVDPGLHFKWPYPIQRVMTYDTRVRVFQTRQETQQTQDNRQLVVQAFCTWRVTDPLQFFRRFSNAGERPIDHFREAEQSLDSSMRTAMSAVSSYRMDELFTVGGAQSRLPELEEQILAGMRASIAASAVPTGTSGISTGGSFGVEIVSVGIARVQLPEAATEAVFARITSTQDRLAQEIQSRGEAERQAITARAQSAADQIRAFAERRAASIRAQGERESAQFLAQMTVAPELAVFIQQMEFIAKMVAGRVTLVFPTSMPGFGPLEPTYLQSVPPGQIPASGFPSQWATTPDAGSAAAAPPTTPPAAGAEAPGSEENNR